MQIIDTCEDNTKLFNVLLNYLLQVKKSGVDPDERVRRRVIRVRHLLSTIIINGMQSGEFKTLNVKNVNEMLYALIESAVFRIAVLDQKDITEIREALNTAVDSLVKY